MSTPTEADRRAQRLRSYSVKNMVYSMVAVLAVVFAWWALMPNPETLQRRPVEVAPVAGYAAEQVPWGVWAPPEGGAQWSVTFARFEELETVTTWRMGLVSPGQEYVELNQAADVTGAWLSQATAGGEQQGERTVSGPGGAQQWQEWQGPEGPALVLVADDPREATTVVRGGASLAELEEFIGLLEPVEP